MRTCRLPSLALVLVAAATIGGCASPTTRVNRSTSVAPPSGTSSSPRARFTGPTTLRCPVTSKPLKPRAGSNTAPLPEGPSAALACITNAPAGKRAAIGPGLRLPASVAVVLARLIDQAAPASAATAERCAPSGPALLIRFGYPAGAADLVESSGCTAGHLAYIHDRGYLLSPVLAGYLSGITDPSGTALTPQVMGQTLPQARAAARRAGDTIELAGEILDSSAPAGTVLLQQPTVDHQVDVIAAVHRSRQCRAGQLAMQYLPGAAATGSDFGTILLRNVSPSWCELGGPVAITGLTGTRPVTHTLTLTVADHLELSPHAAPAAPGHALPADQLTALTRLSAGYRDDTNGSSCQPHWVVPQAWQIKLGRQTLTVANGRDSADTTPPGAGGLITCRARFDAGPMHAATSE